MPPLFDHMFLPYTLVAKNQTLKTAPKLQKKKLQLMKKINLKIPENLSYRLRE